MWKRQMFTRTLRDHRDTIKEIRASRLGGHLELHLSGRAYRAEFIDGIAPVKYVIDRDRCFDERHGRVDNAEYAQILAALTMAVHDCYDATVLACTPSAPVYEIHFAPGKGPFGSGRRVFIEGRLADLMRGQLGESVTFEYPVRVDGAAPQWVKMEAAWIERLEPVA
jgi:hypothetical protein